MIERKESDELTNIIMTKRYPSNSVSKNLHMSRNKKCHAK